MCIHHTVQVVVGVPTCVQVQYLCKRHTIYCFTSPYSICTIGDCHGCHLAGGVFHSDAFSHKYWQHVVVSPTATCTSANVVLVLNQIVLCGCSGVARYICVPMSSNVITHRGVGNERLV